MTRRAAIWRLARVAVSLGLAGCVTPPLGVPVPGADTPARGSIATRVGRAGFVVAAPHGTSDAQTGAIADEVARRTGFGLVVASGFNLEPDTAAGPGRRYQVTRPLEGVPGRPSSEERETPAARRVYEAYERRVREVAQGPLRFYAEIDGGNRRGCTDRIEIATIGADPEFAVRLRALAELIRDAWLRAHAGVPHLDVLVEPAPFDSRSGAKREGILRLPERALHIEFPKCARGERRAVYIGVLADFIAQAGTLPVGR